MIRIESGLVHAFDLDTLWPAIIVKFVRGNKLFYSIFDFYANNIPNGDFQFLRDIIKHMVAFTEKSGIRFSDAIFLADESRFEEVKGSKIRELTYIYNSPPDFVNIKNNRSSPKNHLKVFYGGLIDKKRGLEHMIEAVSDLNNVELTLAGVGTDVEFIIEELKKHENMKYLGWLPSYEDIIIKTLENDVVFRFSDPKIPKTIYESPNKLFEAMMCSKPIIVSDNSSMANIVIKEKCGVVVKYGDVKAIRDSIILLRDDRDLAHKLGRNGRNAYENEYDWNIMENRLLKVYKSLGRSVKGERY